MPFDLGHQVVQLGLAFGLEHRLVEVEEGVGGVRHLGGGGRLGSRSRGRGRRAAGGGAGGAAGAPERAGGADQGAVAADGGGGGGPVGVAPAQLGGAVAPHHVRPYRFASCRRRCRRWQPERARARERRQRSRCKTAAPLCSVSSWFSSWGKVAAALRQNYVLSDQFTNYVRFIVPYAFTQSKAAVLAVRRTKPQLRSSVALTRQLRKNVKCRVSCTRAARS